jgi:hypothetical protein
MSAAKSILEEVALREFGAITEETLRLATPIAQAELEELERKAGYPTRVGKGAVHADLCSGRQGANLHSLSGND